MPSWVKSALSLFVCPAASALIIFGTDQNPLPPTLPGASDLGSLVGEIGTTNTPGFLGTPIGPRHFLTAAHVGFSLGDTFHFREVPYRIMGRTNLPNSDLAVGTVDSDFPAYAPLYERTDEERRTLIILGKGRWKGDPVTVAGELRGWRQAHSGPPGIRWGTNQVRDILRVTNPEPDQVRGEFLVADFDRDGGDDEVFPTSGDSGSPVFIADCGIWKLAAVASAVDGPFRFTTNTTEAPFIAALFDAGGLFVDGATPEWIPDTAVDAPASWYAARVSVRVRDLREISGVLNPPPATPFSDTFAWLRPGDPLQIPLPLSAGRETASVTCVDEVSLEGVAIQLNGATAEYANTRSDLAVDSFRYAFADTETTSGGGSVYLVAPPTSALRPELRRAADGTAVILWPEPAFTVERAQVGPSVEGPWEDLPHEPARLDDFLAFADPSARHRAASFYRLIGGSARPRRSRSRRIRLRHRPPP